MVCTCNQSNYTISPVFLKSIAYNRFQVEVPVATYQLYIRLLILELFTIEDHATGGGVFSSPPLLIKQTLPGLKLSSKILFGYLLTLMSSGTVVNIQCSRTSATLLLFHRVNQKCTVATLKINCQK